MRAEAQRRWRIYFVRLSNVKLGKMHQRSEGASDWPEQRPHHRAGFRFKNEIQLCIIIRSPPPSNRRTHGFARISVLSIESQLYLIGSFDRWHLYPRPPAD